MKTWKEENEVVYNKMQLSQKIGKLQRQITQDRFAGRDVSEQQVELDRLKKMRSEM